MQSPQDTDWSYACVCTGHRGNISEPADAEDGTRQKVQGFFQVDDDPQARKCELGLRSSGNSLISAAMQC